MNLHRITRLPFNSMLCTTLLVLSGCGLGRSDADRINAAMPVSAPIVAARIAIDALAKSLPQDARPIDDEFDSRLRERARACAHGYQPSVFVTQAQIRDALLYKDCFAKSDQALQEWLERRRIGLLLAAPAMRPIPQLAPTVIPAGGSIVHAEFAARAGVALVQESGKYELIDIGTGAVIARGQTDSAIAQSLSPNGRLFVVDKGGNAEIHASEDGAVLATFQRIQASGFHWVNDTGAIFKPAWIPDEADGRQPGPVLLDFTSGRQASIPMVTGAVNHVIGLPGPGRRFAVLAGNKIGEVALTQARDHWDASLLSQRQMPLLVSWATITDGRTADGTIYFGTGQGLQLLTLASLGTQEITLDPMRLKSAVATPDPDRLLLTGMFLNAPGQDEYCLYSLRQRTLAYVDPKRLLSPRIIYIPSLRRNAAIEDSRIVLIDSIPTAVPIPINDYLEQREQAVGALQNGAQPQVMQPQVVQPAADPAAPLPRLR